MTEVAAWPAPAKLNLMLRIVGRRHDGYHLLQTVFQFIDLADSLTFRVRDDGVIRRISEFDGVPAECDLVVRAATLLQRETACTLGCDVQVDKRIPLGGGLGGGSSDAATTLVALNEIWACGLDKDRLAELGLGLGADVPIFVHGHAAWAEGVGEEFTSVTLPEPHYLLVVPPVHVETAKVFQDPDLTRNSRRITIRDFLAGETLNDCLPVVRKGYPEVAQAFDLLEKKLHVRMTGTGATLFVACADPDAAERLLRDLPGDMRTHLVRGSNRSPLLDVLDAWREAN